MKSGIVLSFVLLMAPMTIRLSPHVRPMPTLAGAAVSIETISKSDDDIVSLGVSMRAQGNVLATHRKIDGTWYEGSSFEAILDVRPVLKSDFLAGDVTLSPSRPLLQDWILHCDVTFRFSDQSAIKVSWRDVNLRAGAGSVTRNWNVANCLPSNQPVPAEHPKCALQMIFRE